MPPAQDTRTRIQEVALELFTEQGYEKTSLREIAERLGVTKAALYYHFKSKEEIVQSFVADRATAMEGFLDWAKAQPRTFETRRAMLHRYSDELHQGRHFEVMRFFERNQTVVKQFQDADRMREMIGELVDLLSEPDDPPQRRLKASMAMFALHASAFVLRDPELSDETRRAAALDVALELISS
jgi:AcrR family transcriptional regulator